MANNYFQFKQFIIEQDQCAMKVTTDGCLFGGYVAGEIVNRKLSIDNCLDIGTGTGLLSLMLAQKIDTAIDAIEIDEAAYSQAKENFDQSPWKNRLSIFNADILQFHPGKKMIVSLLTHRSSKMISGLQISIRTMQNMIRHLP